MARFKETASKYIKHYGIALLFIAIFLDFIIETCSRHSPIEAAQFMGMHPLVAVCNVAIIYAVISPALLFRRRIFVTCMISILWLALGIVNGVILLNRMTPFNVKDMSNLGDGMSILTTYFPTKMLIIFGVSIAAAIIVIIVLFRKCPKREERVGYRRTGAIVIVIIALAFGIVQGGMKVGVLDTFFSNLAYAYADNGVPYSFMITWVKTGIDKPKNYDADLIKGIFDEGELGKDGIYSAKDDDATEVDNTPNIIFLQLESFIDPTMVKDVKFSEDPTPYFRTLLKDYSSGYLTVPAVGAGTANVEFEVMTGLSAKDFGPGEYPYKSVLTEKTCESTPFDLRGLGYASHAIHNHRGAFYNRNIVFRNIGFDTFTCLEYMNNVTKTPKNWAKDAILVDNINDAMNSTKGPDYIYTISVQGHGKYPTEKVIEDPKITVTDAPNEEAKWAYEYYANQVYEMDKFLKDLTKSLSQNDEDVILILYGDHLPALSMTEDEMVSGDLFKTQYVIWDNMGMDKQDQDIEAYALNAMVMQRLGISNGMMTKFHQNHRNDKNYLENLGALGYDMLYGKQYIYGEKNPYEPTDMRMGVKEIKIDEIVQIGENYYIKGHNFTEFSKISLDGDVLKTVYVSPTILALNEEVDPEEAKNMKVSQVEKNKQVLSTTE